MNSSNTVDRNYIPHPFHYSRFATRLVQTGSIRMGQAEPVVIQSMAISDTMDTQTIVEESIAMYRAGSQLVRITAPGPADAQNLEVIAQKINEQGYPIPLVADIHFAPKAAMIAIEHVDKVRINPGNFSDSKKFKVIDYDDESYNQELKRIRSVFMLLVERALELNKTLRIGSNHGSLSDRILNRYGDTPHGMVESAMEYLRIARDAGFHNLVVSMKASNPQVMIQAYRLLIRKFKDENMDYPLHLGVTEAGFGRDGRIKSAVGIGALLLDGIGDTIRVSLTEDAIHEIPPAREIAKLASNPFTDAFAPSLADLEKKYFELIDPYSYSRLPTTELVFDSWKTGSKNPVGLIVKLDWQELHQPGFREQIRKMHPEGLNAICVDASSQPDPNDLAALGSLLLPVFLQCSLIDYQKIRNHTDYTNIFYSIKLTCHDSEHLESILKTEHPNPFCLEIEAAQSEFGMRDYQNLFQCLAKIIADQKLQVSIRVSGSDYDVQLMRMLVTLLHVLLQGPLPPIWLQASSKSQTDLIYKSSAQCGSLFLDGIGDALLVECADFGVQERFDYGRDLLQATRLRLSKTEFISCPSCGRTIFDLQKTTNMIKEKTGHLKGVKIAIMGCIVNGPGEMADADFGYVGAGPGKIHLYREKNMVQANIPMENAVDELIALIQKHDMWQEPS